MPSADRIFSISGDDDFRTLAMEIFRYQASENALYARYIELLNLEQGRISRPEDIPFLPIGTFREHRVLTGRAEPELVFESSRVTSDRQSPH